MNLNRTMYPPVNNSVPTTLTSAISATDTVINVANAAVLPDAPNLVSIGGQDDNVEVVLYGQKSGNTLSQCLRGHNGTVAQPWAVGTLAYRAMTAYDLTAGQENIAQLNTGKLDVDGDASNVKATFAQAATRGTINTGSTLGTLFGILKKWYADFRDGAWAAFGTGNGDIARGDHNHNGVYLTAETDPTVPAWAKVPAKPTYGVAEISGAVPDTRTINGKALNANITLSAADVGAPALTGGLISQTNATHPFVSVTASRAISISDLGKFLFVNSASDVTLTLPSTVLQDGFEFNVWRQGAGAVKVVAPAGVTLNGVAVGTAAVAEQYGTIGLKQVNAAIWCAFGGVEVA